MKKIYSYASKVSEIVAIISYVGVLASMLLTSCDVFMRKVLNSSILGTYEITEIILACVVFAGMAYAQSKKGLIRVSMFIKMLTRVPRMIIYSINELLACGIVVAVTYAAYNQMLYSIQKTLVTPNLFIPLYPFYGVEMVCMAFFALVLLLDAIYSIMAIFSDEYAADIMSQI